MVVVDMVVCSTMKKIFIFLLVSSAVISAVSAAQHKYVKHRHGNKDHQSKKLAKLAYTLLKLIEEKKHPNSNKYHSAPIQRYQPLDGFSEFLPSLNPFFIHKNKYIYKNRRSGSQKYKKAIDEKTSNSIDDFLSKTSLRKAENPAYGIKDFVKDVLDELLPSLHEQGNNDSDEAILEILVEHSGSGNRKKVYSKKIPNAFINKGDGFKDLSVLPLPSREYNKYHNAYDGYGIQDINSKELANANDATLIDTKYGTRSHWGGYSTNYIDSKNLNRPETGFINNKSKWEPKIKADTSVVESKLQNSKMNSGSFEKYYKNIDTSNWSNFNQQNSNANKHTSYTYQDYINKYFKSNSNYKDKYSVQHHQFNHYDPYLGNYGFYYPENKERSPEKINSENVSDNTDTNISDSYIAKDRIIEILDHYKKLLLDEQKAAQNVKIEKTKQENKFVLPIGHFDKKYIVNNLFNQNSYKTADKLESDYNSEKYFRYGDSSEKYDYANELDKKKLESEDKYYNDKYGKYYYGNSEKFYYGKELDKKKLAGKDKYSYDNSQNHYYDSKSDKNPEKYYKYGDSSEKYYYANELLAKKNLDIEDKYYNDKYGKYYYGNSEKFHYGKELDKKELAGKDKHYYDNSQNHYYNSKSDKNSEKYYKYGDSSEKYYYANELAKRNLDSENKYYNDKYGKYYHGNSEKFYYGNELDKKELAGKDKYYYDHSQNHYYDSESDKKYLGGKALGSYYGPCLNKNYETEKSREVSDFDHIGDYNANAQKVYDTFGSCEETYNQPNYVDVEPTHVDTEFKFQPFKENVKNVEPQYIDPSNIAHVQDQSKSIESKIPDGYGLLGTYGADKSKSIQLKELGLSSKVSEGKYELKAVYDKDQSNELYFDDTQPPKLHDKETLRLKEVDVGKSKYEEELFCKESPEDLYEKKTSVYEEKTKDKKKKVCKKGKKAKKKCKKCKKAPTLEGFMFAFRYKSGTKAAPISIKSDTVGKPNIAVEVKKNGVKTNRAVENAQDYQLYHPNTRRYGYTDGNDYQPAYEYVDEAAYAPYARTYSWT